MKRKDAKSLLMQFFATVVAMIAVSCGPTPSGIIKPDKMARLMADIHIGEAVAEQNTSVFRADSMKQLLKESIYARNGVTVAEVDSSLAWYGRHTDVFVEVYQKTEQLLQSDLEKLNENAATNLEIREVVGFEAEGDSVDIWQLYRNRAFTPSMGSDRIAFEIKSDRYWDKGDRYLLRFKMLNTRHQFGATMAADYTDGTTTYVYDTPSSDGWHSLVLSLDVDKMATLVYGVISYPSDSVADKFGATLPTVVDSISLIRLRSGHPVDVVTPNQRNIKTRN